MKLLCVGSLLLLFFHQGFSQSKPTKKPLKQAVQGGYTITGFLKNAANRKIYLTENAFYKSRQLADTTVANAKGQFSFNGKLDEASFFSLRVDGKTSPQYFFLENSPISITGNADSLWAMKVTGSKEETIRQKVQQLMQDTAIGNRFKRAELNYTNARAVNDGNAMQAAIKDRQTIVNQELNRVKKIIATYSTSAVGVNVLSVLINMGDVAGADSLLTVMESNDIGKTLQAKYFRQQIDVMSRLNVGKLAPEFAQTDTLGNVVKLSSFKGKYVLVDFWASWCGPCREENPNLVQTYQTFKDKNFTIFSVSLDNNRQNWLNAIRKDQLTWSHVSDLKGWKNDVAQQYGISSVPANLLLDPTGKIIARNLRGNDLNKKIQELIQ